MRDDLIGYLLGALDDEEASRVAKAIHESAVHDRSSQDDRDGHGSRPPHTTRRATPPQSFHSIASSTFSVGRCGHSRRIGSPLLRLRAWPIARSPSCVPSRGAWSNRFRGLSPLDRQPTGPRVQ
jgi:hypothetical protein